MRLIREVRAERKGEELDVTGREHGYDAIVAGEANRMVSSASDRR
jgi:hypothetical protein